MEEENNNNNKQKKRKIFINIFFICVLLIITAVIFLINTKEVVVNPDEVRCLGEHSTLYIQEGCSHCETQLKMFGNTTDMLDVVNCFYDRELCWTDELQNLCYALLVDRWKTIRGNKNYC